MFSISTPWEESSILLAKHMLENWLSSVYFQSHPYDYPHTFDEPLEIIDYPTLSSKTENAVLCTIYYAGFPI